MGIHFLKAYDNSYSKMKKEGEYKDNDKDKDAKRITESLTVCYIFGVLTTQAFHFHRHFHSHLHRSKFSKKNSKKKFQKKISKNFFLNKFFKKNSKKNFQKKS